MTENFEETLTNEFPFMAGVGIDCGAGWYPLIRDLCKEIAAAYEAAGKPPDIVVWQAKEKFGQLRFYCHSQDPRIYGIVDKYEDMSTRVCELCGKPGCLRTDLPWIQTLCDEHYQEKAPQCGRRME